MSIGDKIKTLRKHLGLTQTELGQKLGVKTNAVSKWECGRVEDIPMSKVKAMAILFGVTPSYLIDEEIGELPDDTPKLTAEEIEMLEIFRLIPSERRKLFLETGRLYADNL